MKIPKSRQYHRWVTALSARALSGESVYGEAKDVQINVNSEFGVTATWNNDHPDAALQVPRVYVDGLIKAAQPGAFEAQLAGFGPGGKRIDINYLRPNRTYQIDMITGTRLVVGWSPSLDADLSHYSVEYGIGGFTNSERVDEITLHQLQTGPIHIKGTYAGPHVNDVLTIEITDVNQAHVVLPGVLDRTIQFEVGDTISLGYGIDLYIAAEPVLHEVYTTSVLVTATYQSLMPLPPGTYQVRVKAYDLAGNVSTSETDQVIINDIDYVSNVRAEIVEDGVSITWDALPSGVIVNVYSNYSQVFDVFRDYIYDRWPTASSSTNEVIINCPTDQAASLRFFVRAVVAGVENDDITVYELLLPEGAQESSLGDPALLNVTQVDATTAYLSWRYQVQPNDTLTGFIIYMAVNDGASAAYDQTIATPDAEGDLMSFAYTLDLTDFSDGDELVLTVAAIDDVNVVMSEESVQLKVDKTAPSFSSKIYAYPN